MSALSHKRTLRYVRSMSALPPKADIAECDWHVRFVPNRIAAMLVQIDQNSATVTPFGSLGSVNDSANANGAGQSFGRRPNAIRLVWRWICHLFAPV